MKQSKKLLLLAKLLLSEEQQAAYAGKFKDAEELEKAYIELQKKLGESNDSEETEGLLREQEETAEEEVEVSPAAELINICITDVC